MALERLRQLPAAPLQALRGDPEQEGKVMKTEEIKTTIKDLCLEIIGLSYESRPDPMKILNRAMALANANGDLAREWADSRLA